MKYRNHKYTWSKPYVSVKHQWEFIGRHGGIYFYAYKDPIHKEGSKTYGVVNAGLDVYYFRPPSYMNDDPPSLMDCWLLNGPCWHDKTSWYAAETMWKKIEGMLLDGNHEAIFSFLEQDADQRFSQFVYTNEAEEE